MITIFKVISNHYNFVAGEIIALVPNADYDMDRYALSVYFQKPDGSFSWAGFEHEDSWSYFGQIIECNYANNYNMKVTGLWAENIKSEHQTPDMKKFVAEREKCYVFDKMHLELQYTYNNKFINETGAKKLLSYYGTNKNLADNVIILIKEHNASVAKIKAAKRVIWEAKRNTIGNMFPELRKLVA